MFNTLDYTMGTCWRCGKELFVHNGSGLCLICEFDMLSEEVANLRKEVKDARSENERILKELERLRSMGEDDGR